MYLGEIVRLIILDLVHQNLLFINQGDRYGDYKTPLFTRGGFYTKYVSAVETDEGIAFSNTRRVLEDIGIRNPTFDDCAIIQHICKNVSKRAARLSAAGKREQQQRSDGCLNSTLRSGVAVLINRIEKPMVTVGVDGSVYRYHPKFKRNMEKCIKGLIKKSTKVRKNSLSVGAARWVDFFQFALQLADDGSGVGAALSVAAAMKPIDTEASKLSKRSQ